MILFIDTSDFHNLRLGLIKKTESISASFSVAFNENYKTNTFLQKFLQQNQIKISDVKKIIVCSGPGSFTGLRVGISLAQAIGYAQNIPVTLLSKEKIPNDLSKLILLKASGNKKVFYGQAPNITKKKK